jgi:hypothetical protein
MAVFENESGLPEDRFVNTWHFVSSEVDSAARTAIAAQVISFYNGLATGQPLATFLSGKIKRTAQASQVRIYNLADVKPREPSIHTFTLEGGDSSQDLPNEVAVTMSFYADRNLPRQRGRLYLGPLKLLGVGNGVADSEVGANLKDGIWQGLDAMALVSGNAVWCVYSQMDGVMRPVSNVWVDNAFDTQRRRGAIASSRWERAVAPVG